MAVSQNRILKQTVPESNLSLLTQSSATISNLQVNKLSGTTITKNNFQDICRCCIVNRGETSLFEPHFNKMPLSDLVQKCTNEKIVRFDGLPKSVCNVCKQLIIDSFMFVERVKKVQLHIHELQKVISSKYCEVNYNPLIFKDETISLHKDTSLNKDTSLHENRSLPKDILLHEDTPLPKDISMNEDTSLHEDVSLHENIDDRAHLVSAKSFKNKFKGLSKVYKELCEVLVENRKQLKRSIEPKQKQYSPPFKEVVKDPTEEIQEVNADNALEEEKNKPITPTSLEVSEFYEEPSDNQKIEIYNLPEGAIEENLPKLVTSDFDDLVIKNDGQLTRIGEEKKVQCFECFETFQTEMGLTKHCRKTSHVSGALFKCDSCSATFDRQRYYNEHVRRHASNAAKSICELCGAKITTNNLKRHMDSHSLTKNHVCQFCGRNYTQKAFLQFHINTSHFNIKANSLCFLCGKSFHSVGALNTHLNIHHKNEDLENKAYSCELCRKYFVSMSSLKMHKRVRHCGEPKTFYRYRDGTMHKKEKKAINMKIKRLKFDKQKCMVCLKMINIPGFKTHMLIHQNLKPFPCNICQRQFRQKQQLQSHMNIHLNLKPYECKYCKKRFRHSTTHLVHVRSHTGEAPYKCEFCDKGFAHLSSMKKHSEIHFKRTKKIKLELSPVPRTSRQKFM